MSLFIKFRSLKRLLGGQVVAANDKDFTVVNVKNLGNGKAITHIAKVSRNIDHELIDTDTPGYVRKQTQLRTYWYWMHPRGGMRMHR